MADDDLEKQMQNMDMNDTIDLYDDDGGLNAPDDFTEETKRFGIQQDDRVEEEEEAPTNAIVETENKDVEEDDLGIDPDDIIEPEDEDQARLDLDMNEDEEEENDEDEEELSVSQADNTIADSPPPTTLPTAFSFDEPDLDPSLLTQEQLTQKQLAQQHWDAVYKSFQADTKDNVLLEPFTFPHDNFNLAMLRGVQELLGPASSHIECYNDFVQEESAQIFDRSPFIQIPLRPINRQAHHATSTNASQVQSALRASQRRKRKQLEAAENDEIVEIKAPTLNASVERAVKIQQAVGDSTRQDNLTFHGRHSTTQHERERKLEAMHRNYHNATRITEELKIYNPFGDFEALSKNEYSNWRQTDDFKQHPQFYLQVYFRNRQFGNINFTIAQAKALNEIYGKDVLCDVYRKLMVVYPPHQKKPNSNITLPPFKTCLGWNSMVQLLGGVGCEMSEPDFPFARKSSEQLTKLGISPTQRGGQVIYYGKVNVIVSFEVKRRSFLLRIGRDGHAFTDFTGSSREHWMFTNRVTCQINTTATTMHDVRRPNTQSAWAIANNDKKQVGRGKGVRRSCVFQPWENFDAKKYHSVGKSLKRGVGQDGLLHTGREQVKHDLKLHIVDQENVMESPFAKIERGADPFIREQETSKNNEQLFRPLGNLGAIQPFNTERITSKASRITNSVTRLIFTLNISLRYSITLPAIVVFRMFNIGTIPIESRLDPIAKRRAADEVLQLIRLDDTDEQVMQYKELVYRSCEMDDNIYTHRQALALLGRFATTKDRDCDEDGYISQALYWITKNLFYRAPTRTARVLLDKLMIFTVMANKTIHTELRMTRETEPYNFAFRGVESFSSILSKTMTRAISQTHKIIKTQLLGLGETIGNIFGDDMLFHRFVDRLDTFSKFMGKWQTGRDNAFIDNKESNKGARQTSKNFNVTAEIADARKVQNQVPQWAPKETVQVDGSTMNMLCGASTTTGKNSSKVKRQCITATISSAMMPEDDVIIQNMILHHSTMEPAQHVLIRNSALPADHWIYHNAPRTTIPTKGRVLVIMGKPLGYTINAEALLFDLHKLVTMPLAKRSIKTMGIHYNESSKIIQISREGQMLCNVLHVLDRKTQFMYVPRAIANRYMKYTTVFKTEQQAENNWTENHFGNFLQDRQRVTQFRDEAQHMFRTRCFRFVDAFLADSVAIADGPTTLARHIVSQKPRKKQFIVIHSASILSIESSMGFGKEFEHGVRRIYDVNISQQLVSYPSFDLREDFSRKHSETLIYGDVPLVTNVESYAVGTDEIPYGINVVCMPAALNGRQIEDSRTACQTAEDHGLYNDMTSNVYPVRCYLTRAHAVAAEEAFKNNELDKGHEIELDAGVSDYAKWRVDKLQKISDLTQGPTITVKKNKARGHFNLYLLPDEPETLELKDDITAEAEKCIQGHYLSKFSELLSGTETDQLQLQIETGQMKLLPLYKKCFGEERGEAILTCVQNMIKNRKRNQHHNPQHSLKDRCIDPRINIVYKGAYLHIDDTYVRLINRSETDKARAEAKAAQPHLKERDILQICKYKRHSVPAKRPGVVVACVADVNEKTGFCVIHFVMEAVRPMNDAHKYANAGANKNTASNSVPVGDMPTTQSGVKPQVVIGVHSISRLTASRHREGEFGEFLLRYCGYCMESTGRSIGQNSTFYRQYLPYGSATKRERTIYDEYGLGREQYDALMMEVMSKRNTSEMEWLEEATAWRDVAWLQKTYKKPMTEADETNLMCAFRQTELDMARMGESVAVALQLIDEKTASHYYAMNMNDKCEFKLESVEDVAEFWVMRVLLWCEQVDAQSFLNDKNTGIERRQVDEYHSYVLSMLDDDVELMKTKLDQFQDANEMEHFIQFGNKRLKLLNSFWRRLIVHKRDAIEGLTARFLSGEFCTATHVSRLPKRFYEAPTWWKPQSEELLNEAATRAHEKMHSGDTGHALHNVMPQLYLRDPRVGKFNGGPGGNDFAKAVGSITGYDPKTKQPSPAEGSTRCSEMDTAAMEAANLSKRTIPCIIKDSDAVQLVVHADCGEILKKQPDWNSEVWKESMRMMSVEDGKKQEESQRQREEIEEQERVARKVHFHVPKKTSREETRKKDGFVIPVVANRQAKQSGWNMGMVKSSLKKDTGFNLRKFLS